MGGGKREKKDKAKKKKEKKKKKAKKSKNNGSKKDTARQVLAKGKKRKLDEALATEPPVPSAKQRNKKKKKTAKKASKNSGAVASKESVIKKKHGNKGKRKGKAKEKSEKRRGTSDLTVGKNAAVPGWVAKYRKEKGISISQEDEGILPFATFAEASEHFPTEAIETCISNFSEPSPIQAQCWPAALRNRDIVGIAETGSGKTLGFLLPAFNHTIKSSRRGSSPQVLILAPTRELAMQINTVVEEFGTPCGVTSITVYGGVSKGPQIAALKKGVHIVIATPGRLLDLVGSNLCDLSQVTFLVLDEADQMLDLGFEPDIRAIVKEITTRRRQTLMFTATWPESIRKLAHSFLDKPVKVNIGEIDNLNANLRITQIVKVVDPKSKDRHLEDLLTSIHAQQDNKVLVFALYKKEAVRVGNNLLRRGWNVGVIQGDMNQADRSKCIENFKKGTVPLLVATDVAARGIDVPDIEYVVNYTFPLTIEQYVHRIGRTGRAGKDGTAYTFFTQYDKAHTGELVNVLNDAEQEVPQELLKFGVAVKKKAHPIYGAHYKDTSKITKKKTHIKF